MKSIMEVDEVRYRYAGTDKEALKGLSLRIPEGKRTAICGHNGSGKSTLFLHAIGIYRPQSGQVRWKGQPVSYRPGDLRELRRKVGLVFQDPEQQLILNTPYEDIAYGMRNAGLPEPDIRARTERMISSMGLQPWADTPLHHLSLGMKKRTALAGVLALEPELLLLDEPTAYLDRKSEGQLIEELNRIHAEGITIAMATHDMNLAYCWADWILVMDRGQCVMAGTPHEVFGQEQHIQSLGLELPLLYEVWQALPSAIRREAAPPRSIDSLKRYLSGNFG
ncbi:energy-coupling factor ABC transporter ATP-binding protein [Paenibacillus oenotherae]|uniref:Energy-coupling factor ABC transporter ATP-binding protein n=1 Tax=Paenibacillus oenotherae TaxID=1435645 RepID=A0ABS7DBI1_9BACL|nr:ABC transporter ATP-binding protein [Paenibacillus oenotherae]MBW7477292.1 energy-coupling factor ABC transporter ATP-binding protein [Paenibacillus oenotherae]